MHPSLRIFPSRVFPFPPRLAVSLPVASSCSPPVRCTCRYPRSLDPPQTHKFSPSAPSSCLLPSVTLLGALRPHGNRSEIPALTFSVSSSKRKQVQGFATILCVSLTPRSSATRSPIVEINPLFRSAKIFRTNTFSSMRVYIQFVDIYFRILKAKFY